MVVNAAEAMDVHGLEPHEPIIVSPDAYREVTVEDLQRWVLDELDWLLDGLQLPTMGGNPREIPVGRAEASFFDPKTGGDLPIVHESEPVWTSDKNFIRREKWSINGEVIAERRNGEWKFPTASNEQQLWGTGEYLLYLAENAQRHDEKRGTARL